MIWVLMAYAALATICVAYQSWTILQLKDDLAGQREFAQLLVNQLRALRRTGRILRTRERREAAS